MNSKFEFYNETIDKKLEQTLDIHVMQLPTLNIVGGCRYN